MKKIIIVCFIFSIVYLTNTFGQGKAVETGVEVTNTAEITGDTKEAKTIKVEEQAPGVITEYKEDGTKVVTINLSEVDENKLPEKYEAEVILEAPIYQITSGNRELYYKNELLGKFERNSTFKLNKRNITESGTFLKGGVDNYPDGLDVKIDDGGNIFILDLYNGRIQKFNSKGKHVKNIPIKDYFEFGGEEGGWPVVVKDEIEMSGKKIYVRDTAKNRIETYDESGNVVETIDIPEKIDGKDTREMKMWADEEGVGVGEKVFKKENGKVEIKNKIMQQLKNKIKELKDVSPGNIDKKKRTFNINGLRYDFICNKQDEVRISQPITIDQIDKYGNNYISIYTKFSKGGTIKLSPDGRVLAIINIIKYWYDPKWKGNCDSVGYLNNSGGLNYVIDKNGNIYLLQQICCPDNSCITKMRIIKLSLNKGK